MRRLPFYKMHDFTLLEDETDLSLLKGRKALILLDEQNLSEGAKNFHYSLDYAALMERIRAATKEAKVHLFTAVDSYNGQRARYFENLGFIVHCKTTRFIRLSNGSLRCDRNIDNLLSFWAGIYAARICYEVIVFGSGDYGLGGELSEAISARPKKRPVQLMTLSLPGSTAEDLDARTNPNITANMEIGLDVLTLS